MNEFHRLLGTALSDPLWAATVQRALALIQHAEMSQASYGTGDLQSSIELEKTYKLRRSIGYFDKKKVHGLDETIVGLGIAAQPVRLLYAKIGTALISIWVRDQSHKVAGLLVMEASE